MRYLLFTYLTVKYFLLRDEVLVVYIPYSEVLSLERWDTCCLHTLQWSTFSCEMRYLFTYHTVKYFLLRYEVLVYIPYSEVLSLERWDTCLHNLQWITFPPEMRYLFTYLTVKYFLLWGEVLVQFTRHDLNVHNCLVVVWIYTCNTNAKINSLYLLNTVQYIFIGAPPDWKSIPWDIRNCSTF